MRSLKNPIFIGFFRDLYYIFKVFALKNIRKNLDESSKNVYTYK